MPPPPPPKSPKKPQPNAPDALRRRLTSDGFQAAPALPKGATFNTFNTDSAGLDRSKAISGIVKRLISKGQKISRELDEELLRLAKSSISGDEWQLLQRIILAGPAPENPQDAKMESRRFLHEIEGPLARLANSYHLRLLREKGAPESDLLRGADLVLAEGGKLYERLAEINCFPGKGPFPGARLVRLPSFGVLFFARHGEEDLIVRLEAPLAQMRTLAPQLMAFFEQNFAEGQNIGPMGCSPRTLRSGKPAVALCG